MAPKGRGREAFSVAACVESTIFCGILQQSTTPSNFEKKKKKK